jgi:signal transduction histidine kinase
MKIESGKKEFLHKVLEDKWFQYIVVFLAYYSTAKLGQYLFNDLDISPAVIWAPAGIALAAVFLRGYKMLVPIVLAQLLSTLTSPMDPPMIIVLTTTLGYTLQAFLGSYALKKLDFTGSFEKVRDVLIFLLSALIIPVLAPLISTTVRYITGNLNDAFALTLTRAWAGGMLSILVLTPVLIVWLTQAPTPKSQKYKREKILALVVLLAVVYGIFWTELARSNSFLAIYIFFGVFFWIGLRLSTRMMIVSIFLATVLAMTGVILVPRIDTPLNQRLFGVELFIELVAPIFLILSAVVGERRFAISSLEGYAQELEKALQKLSQEDRYKNEFIATLAHELRNPIAPVMSTLELLKLKAVNTDPDSLELIKKAEYQIHIMRRLLDDLLDISRLTQNKFKLQKEKSDLGTMVDRCVDNVESIMKARHHTLSVSMPREKIILNVDPVRFEQIITNLLHNAIKYTNPGGQIELVCVLGREELVLKVRDSGIGIDPDAIGDIFMPFHQVHPATSKSTGLGIGLAITKKLVEMHEGVIEVKSDGLGKGSTFVCRFPVTQSEKILHVPQATYEAEANDERGIEPLKILVVDDNEAAADGLGKLLQHRGHSVAIVYFGKEVLPKASEFNPHVILLDIGLPDIDGYEVARSLRSNNFNSKIIAVTGYGQDEDIRKATLAGFDNHLTKPVSIHDIDALL